MRLEKLPDRLFGLAYIDGEHHQPLAGIAAGDVVDRGLVAAAVRAPGRPEFQQDHASAEGHIVKPLAIERLGGELRYRRSNIGDGNSAENDEGQQPAEDSTQAGAFHDPPLSRQDRQLPRKLTDDQCMPFAGRSVAHDCAGDEIFGAKVRLRSWRSACAAARLGMRLLPC